MIGIAATGSGKTMAFLVPALLKIAKHGETNSAGTFRKGMHYYRQRGSSYLTLIYDDMCSGKGPTPKPQVLIMAPTR